MISRRRIVIALGAGALATPLVSFAQSQQKVHRIGHLSPDTNSTDGGRLDALRTGLRELGYVEGKNLVIETRWAEGNSARLPELAAELVGLKVDILVTYTTRGTRAAKQATATIPIVMASSGDAVATGLIASLGRPGGNITGTTFFETELSAKCLELLKEAVSRARRVAVLFYPDNPANKVAIEEIGSAANALKLELLRFAVHGPGEFENAFSAMAKQRADGVLVCADSRATVNAKSIADFAAKHRLPLIGLNNAICEAGGMISYGVNLVELSRRAAYFVDKILKGAKPGDIPVEQPTKFEMVVNMKTAKALGIKIPQTILVRATKVIE